MKKRLAILLLAGTLLGAGCGNSDDFVFTNNNTPQIAAPVCADDAYTTNANTTLTVNAATGVLANDTPNGATLAFQATSANGGTITGAQDGSFVYVPRANFFGVDTFSYTLANFGGATTCTVTITVNAVNGFFVDAATGNDGTGSFTNGVPFATVQAAVAAAGTNQDIVVRPGSYTGTVTLKNGQRLLGSGSVLAQGVVRPTLSGPVVMADGCTLDFLRIANSPADCVDADGQAGGTVTNCELDSAAGTQQGFSGDGISGSWTVSNNIIQNATAAGVAIQITGTGTAVVRIENNVLNSNAAGGIASVARDSSTLKLRVANNTFSLNNLQAFTATARDSANYCLDLQSNSNDGIYELAEETGPSLLQVEQLTTLTQPRPGGGGNTGTINILDDGPGGIVEDPTEVGDGVCGF